MLRLKLNHILIASVALILGACATATPYQAASKTGAAGYSSTQIESDRYSVNFSGNSLTDRETVETYLLYRAAELTANNGYDYFTVAQRDTEEKKRIVSTPTAQSSLYHGHGYGFANPFYSGFYCDYDFYNPRFGWRSSYTPAGYVRYPSYTRFGHNLGHPIYGGRLNNRLHPFYSGYYNGFGARYYDPFYTDFNYREITNYKAKAEIILHRGAKPSEAENAFNAVEVLSNLRDKVIFPDDTKK